VKLFDDTLASLQRSLDVRLERQTVIAGNIANADTPGFVPMDVDFHQAMEQAQLKESEPGPIALDSAHAGFRSQQLPQADGSLPRVVAEGSAPGIDGNGVDIDRAMVSMAQNAIQYAAATKAAAKKLAILRYVASDGAA